MFFLYLCNGWFACNLILEAVRVPEENQILQKANGCPTLISEMKHIKGKIVPIANDIKRVELDTMQARVYNSQIVLGIEKSGNAEKPGRKTIIKPILLFQNIKHMNLNLTQRIDRTNYTIQLHCKASFHSSSLPYTIFYK